MKSLLVVFSAILVAGCSTKVDVVHETEDDAHTPSSGTYSVERFRITVAANVLNHPDPSPETKHTDSHESATPSIQRSKTTVKIVVPESSPRVLIPTPPVLRCPEPTIQVAGDGNTVAFGDVHIHHHEHKHFHVHETPKPHPERVDVRIELGDRFSERERRRRMVERRIAKFFPHYRD